MTGGEIPSVDVMLAIDLSGSMSGEPTRKAIDVYKRQVG